MCKVHSKMRQGAHPETTINEQAFCNKLAAESQPCLHLVAVEGWYLVHHNLSLERALELQQDNGPVQGLEVTVWTAGQFAIEGMTRDKIERDCVTKHLGVMLPLNKGTSEWLEEFAPSTSNVVAKICSGVKLLANQACWGVPGGSPCQDSDFGSPDGVLPGFDPSFASLRQARLTLLQESFESVDFGVDFGRHGCGYQVGAFIQLVSLPRLLVARR